VANAVVRHDKSWPGLEGAVTWKLSSCSARLSLVQQVKAFQSCNRHAQFGVTLLTYLPVRPTRAQQKGGCCSSSYPPSDLRLCSSLSPRGVVATPKVLLFRADSLQQVRATCCCPPTGKTGRTCSQQGNAELSSRHAVIQVAAVHSLQQKVEEAQAQAVAATSKAMAAGKALSQVQQELHHLHDAYRSAPDHVCCCLLLH